MQISVKVQLYKQKTYSDGSHPVVLQYIIDRKVRKKVITRCKAQDWNTKASRVKNNVTNAARINHFISAELAKAENDLYDIKSGTKQPSDIFGTRDRPTLKSALDAELIRYQSEHKSGGYDKIRAIEKQIKDTSIKISDIDERWFEKMINQWSATNSGATIKKKIKLIRGLIARYSEKGLTKEVRDVTVTTQKPIRQKLTSAEFERLEALPLIDGEPITVVRDMFLMQVYLRGIRIGDILQAKASDFQEGRFTYTSDKVGKSLSIKLIPKAQAIVDKYSTTDRERLFPLFTWTANEKLTEFENKRNRIKHKESCTTVVNAFLKIIAKMADITKPLSSHIARHTFARMAIDKINNPMITMDLLGHSSLAVHQMYLNDIRKDDELDQAADDIFG